MSFDLSSLLRFGQKRSAAQPSATADAAQPLRDTMPATERDALTGLATRPALQQWLRDVAQQAEAQRVRLALLCIGIGGLKAVNACEGLSAGDGVLREVADRLIAAQQALPPNQTSLLARFAGEEFCLALRGTASRSELAHLASRLLASLGAATPAQGRELALTFSIGLARFPDDGGVSTLIGHAHAAMQAASDAGGGSYKFFERRMEDDARERMDLLRDLRHAVAEQRLELFYQPKIDAKSGQVTAAEALLRWHHPTRGIVSPGVFVPIAERYGLIGALGNWVIEDACRQARVWKDRGLKMRVAINLSVFQMRQDDLAERIQSALARHRIDPSRLTCEITESVAMEDTQATQRTFERLGAAGIHLSIDDFGTGYSSLSYLRRLPAAELKIDRAFVMDVDSSDEARAIVEAVVKLAHAIGLKVVAEGVETEGQRRALLALGCDEMQGYLFARPMSAQALLVWAVEDDAPAGTWVPDAVQQPSFRASLFSDTRPDAIVETQPLGLHEEPALTRISLD